MTLRSITNVFRRLSRFRQRRVSSSTPKERPYQICDQCAPTLFEYYGYDVADIGTCDNCYQKSDCIDVALIEHYRAQEIDEKSIYCTLPRLRQYPNAQPMSWKDIEDRVEGLVAL